MASISAACWSHTQLNLKPTSVPCLPWLCCLVFTRSTRSAPAPAAAAPPLHPPHQTDCPSAINHLHHLLPLPLAPCTSSWCTFLPMPPHLPNPELNLHCQPLLILLDTSNPGPNHSDQASSDGSRINPPKAGCRSGPTVCNLPFTLTCHFRSRPGNCPPKSTGNPFRARNHSFCPPAQTLYRQKMSFHYLHLCLVRTPKNHGPLA